MHKFAGIFDSKKQQGKTVDIFSTKKTQIDLSSQDRNVSPFRGYKQAAPNANFPKGQDLGVSRGIFQNKSGGPSNDSTPLHGRPNYGTVLEGEKSGVYTNHAQVFQDFLNNEFKSQIGQFKSEMVQMMNESLKEFRDKSNKNQETIAAIKDSIKNHSHNIEKLDEKIEEYHTSLATISGMFQSEIEKIKFNLPRDSLSVSPSKRRSEETSTGFSSDRYSQLEAQQQEMVANFEKFRRELAENVGHTLDEYSRSFEQENEEKFGKVSTEMTKNMEQKISKVLEHLDGKVTVLEKQIKDITHSEDPAADKLKFEIEDKFNEETQSLREEIQNLQNQIKFKVDESILREETIKDSSLNQKLAQTQQEMDALKSELASIIEQIQIESKNIDTRMDGLERRINEQPSTTKQEMPLTTDPSIKQIRDDFEKKLITLERKFEEVHQDQRDLNSDLSIQKAQLESFKTTSAISINDIRASQSQIEDVKLRKLEQMIDQLTKNFDQVKEGSSMSDSSLSTKFSETGHGAFSKQENLPSYSHHLGSYSYGDFSSKEVNPAANFGTFPVKTEGHQNIAAVDSAFTQGVKESSPKDYLSSYKVDQEKISTLTTEKPRESADFNKNYLPSDIPETGADFTIQKTADDEAYLKDLTQHSSNWENVNKPAVSYTFEMKREFEKVGGGTSPQPEGTQAPLKNNYMEEQDEEKENVQAQAKGNEEDEVEVVYQIDENGFLMDEDGNYILDDKGETIKLNEEQIERLRENNLLEEENL